MRRFLSTLLVLVFLFPFQNARAAEVYMTRFSPETSHNTSLPFLAAWDRLGGLSQFGYPVSEALLEQNRDLGKWVVSQWFERARMESHADKPWPYRVELGRLGDERLRQLGIDWQSQPKASGPQQGCQFFAETQHNVCGQAGGLGFKSYWLTHGLEFDGRAGTSYPESLALWGFPLTEARVETNSSGDTVLTQWFERGRMEWHPNNPDQYKVLLGLLGNELTTHRKGETAFQPAGQQDALHAAAHCQ